MHDVIRSRPRARFPIRLSHVTLGLICALACGCTGWPGFEDDDDESGSLVSAAVRVSVTTPQSGQTGIVPVDFVLTGSVASTDVTVSYSIDGEIFPRATEAPGGSGTRGLRVTTAGANHSFRWNAAADLAQQTGPTVNVVVRVRAGSRFATTDNFTVNVAQIPETPTGGDVPDLPGNLPDDPGAILRKVGHSGDAGSRTVATREAGAAALAGRGDSRETLHDVVADPSVRIVVRRVAGRDGRPAATWYDDARVRLTVDAVNGLLSEGGESWRVMLVETVVDERLADWAGAAPSVRTATQLRDELAARRTARSSALDVVLSGTLPVRPSRRAVAIDGLAWIDESPGLRAPERWLDAVARAAGRDRGRDIWTEVDTIRSAAEAGARASLRAIWPAGLPR